MAPFELEHLSGGERKRRLLKPFPVDHRVEAVQPTGIPILDKVIVMDSITPFFLLAEARRVYQYVQVMRFATQIARAVTISVLHTEVVDVNVENATANLADGVIEMRKRQGRSC